MTRVSVTVVRKASNTLKQAKEWAFNENNLLSSEAVSITETPLEGEAKLTHMYHTSNILMKYTMTILQQCMNQSIKLHLQYNFQSGNA